MIDSRRQRQVVAAFLIVLVASIGALAWAIIGLQKFESNGWEPFTQAVASGSAKEIRDEYRPSDRYPDEIDPVWLAIEEGRPRVVSLLINDLGYDPNKEINGAHGFTGYLSAVTWGDRDPNENEAALRTWLREGGDPCVVDSQGELAGQTALEIVKVRRIGRQPAPQWLVDLVVERCR